MKVLIINGSPRAHGNTAAALDEMKKIFAQKHKEREAAAKERAKNRAPTVEENIATLVKQNAELLAKLNK